MKFKIHHYSSLTSTQDKAKELSIKDKGNIIVISDKQTEGKGRFNRKWFSSKDSLTMSLLLRPKKIRNMQYLTFIAVIAVVKAIKSISKLDTKIKWPNDVHHNGKKLCGILTKGTFGKENYVIVGIGLNVNQGKFPVSIKNTATSLKILKNKNFSIKKISDLIIKEFFILYEKYYIKNDLDKIIELWKKHCDTLGKKVTVTTKKGKLEGKAIDVDKNCSLILKSKNKLIKVIEGDIKIRY
jgi:BirA family biotin operon repressor/biotin-[acetyl-CoA-carboxylase] ligase